LNAGLINTVTWGVNVLDVSTIWWIGAGVLLALEMITGTFYLLMLALGMVSAALAAHGGWGLNSQIALGAVVGILAVLVCHQLLKERSRVHPALPDNSVNLDICETLLIDAWSEQGQARVRYRGAQWTVLVRGEHPPVAGLHRIVELSGNRLVVEKI